MQETDCWVIIEDDVYDVTNFLKDHPGGAKAIVLYAGKLTPQDTPQRGPELGSYCRVQLD